ncbi:DUF6268 family outer membrane beta-barrel protein [Sphingobacterium sp. SYP-B4668]|uniref:DUF6268 family outer membrane beta-barrel protein n=1 Tax=Sphingobacterium sp. SYP-B4668 TaxID=2996035 RepID=UPI0022DD7E8D|nr:DUF6268 family outer membrane beta-barrel protein [Sphingobacterium sp. SYP-B4668]
MKKLLFFVLAIGTYLDVHAQIQVELKSEYLGKSSYRVTKGETNEKVGNSKGSAKVHQADINIPLSLKLNELKRPTLWAINAGLAYAKLDNENFTEPLVIDKIMNIGISLNHVRPLNDRWSMVASVGGGIYMPSTDFSQMELNNLLGSAGIVFIRHLRPNLDLGGGLALNNSFGFPMVFPAFYLNWRTEGKYDVRIALMKGLEMSVGYNMHRNLRLSIIAEMNGQTALLKQEGKDKIFSHMYLVTGFRPEIKIGKTISIPITAGMNVWRPTQITDRKLKSIFQEKEHYFQASPYGSVGLKMKF